MMTSRLPLLIALIALACDELPAQQPPRVPMSVGRRNPSGRRHFYERPTISPWVGVDFGFAAPAARCLECRVHFGDLASMGTIGAGATILSRLTLGAEETGMKVLVGDEEVSARLRMLTARMGTRSGFLGKAGFGKGRYSVNSARLIEDMAAWTAGIETCGLARLDLCALADYSQTVGSSVRTVNGQPVHYRLRALRAGIVARLHFLKAGTSRFHRVLPSRSRDNLRRSS